MKAFSALTLALILTAPAARATDVPLAPGKPAGLHKAQREEDNRIWLVAGAAMIGIGVALAVSDNNSAPTVAPPATTSSTSTTP